MCREKQIQILTLIFLCIVIEVTQVGLVNATNLVQKHRRRAQSKPKKATVLQKTNPNPEQKPEDPDKVTKTTNEASSKENPSSTPDTDQPIIDRRRYEGVIRGNAISKVSPTYPRDARLARIEGDVVVNITISEKGDVIKASIESGPPELCQAAIDAAVQWKFNPTLMNNKPVKVAGILTFRFQL